MTKTAMTMTLTSQLQFHLITMIAALITAAFASRSSHIIHQGLHRQTSFLSCCDRISGVPKNTNTPSLTAISSLRGGAISKQMNDSDSSACVTGNDENDDDHAEIQRKKREELGKLIKYRMEQHMLYQLRSTYLAEMLAVRGVPNLPTILSVSTADGEKPPEKVDWDCALSTESAPKSCLYSFDAEPNSKVVAPIGTEQWISLSALNRLRRTDPTKVEPMWHSKYSILQSWFSDESEFSLLQHVGMKGFLVSSVLLDGANGMMLRSFLVLCVLSAFLLTMPVIEYIVGRILVSAPFWAQWMTWGRIVRAGFPLKLLIGQLVWKGVASSFTKLENIVREYIVDLECEIFEECIPVTVGVGSEVDESAIGFDESTLDNEDEDEYDYEN